jgi:hypothetical protein
MEGAGFHNGVIDVGTLHVAQQITQTERSRLAALIPKDRPEGPVAVSRG